MKKTSMIAVMVLILNSLQSEARPNGAPSRACRNLVPLHAPNLATDDPFPYEVDLSELAIDKSSLSYEAGRSYRIRLRGTSQDRNFRGFLIQARTVGDNTSVGSFNNGNLYQQVCTNNTAATHTNNRQKSNVRALWTAPPAGTGPVRFWFSFVDVHRGKNSRFWAREMSNVVTEACPIKGQIPVECAPHPSCQLACYRTRIEICPLSCQPNGCVCPKGLIIDLEKNQCVTPNECEVIAVSFSKSLYSAAESNGVVQIVLMLSNVSSTSIAVNVVIIDDLFVGSGDIANGSTPYMVEFAAGMISASFDIPIIDINLPESNRSFTLAIDTPSLPISVTVGDQDQAVVIIVDDDACPIKGQIKVECAPHPSCQLACNSTGNEVCPLSCQINGCVCPNGTVIDWEKNQCVTPNECREVTTCSSDLFKDVVFVIDASGSIGSSRFQLIRDFTANITTELINSSPRSAVGVILFSTRARVEFNLQSHTNLSELLLAIDELPYLTGGTNTAGALRLLRFAAENELLGLRNGSSKIAIVITDGMSNRPIQTELAADELHSLNIFEIYAVGIGSADQTELGTIASSPEFVFFTPDFNIDGLEQIIDAILPPLCIECPIDGQIRIGCAPHPTCQRACNSTGNEICLLSCQINGCVCPNGTVIDWEKNQCVAPNECEVCPIKGQVRKECASLPSCHETCNSTGPTICPEICVINGCECPNGTVIDETTNECVTPEECRVCPIKGQVRKECASPPSCHQTCNSTGPTICPQICIINGCECPDGQIIDESKNECVIPNECEGCPIKGQIRYECASHPLCHRACNNTNITFCPAICIVNGCECPVGTVVDFVKRECVLESQCEVCPIKGQVRRECASHPSCHQTCDNVNDTLACPQVCVVNGCECPNGTVIDEDENECVAPLQCEACPIKGQIRMECASDPSCHLACNSTGPVPCPLVCNINGCECPPGMVIDWSINECVLPRQCEACPIEGQIRKECASPPSCHRTCNSTGPIPCPRICVNHGCECPEGQVIDEDGNKCVTPNECEDCPVQGQIRRICASHPGCHQTCNDIGPIACPRICIVNGCECPLGTVIDEATNECVRPRECQVCPIKGQIRRECASHPSCHQTCNNTEPTICPAICIINGCECPEGTVIDEENQECVLQRECEACPIKGQIRVECALDPSCHLACNSTGPVPCPRICVVNGCQCPTGTVIDWERNECVHPRQCEACPIQGQIRRECASHPSCHLACNSTGLVACPRLCIVDGCECPNGTVIDWDTNECVAPSECSVCPVKGQVRRECASHPSCHPTCSGPEPTFCPAICIIDGCECPPGTVIDEAINECVTPRECEVCPIKGQIRKECASHPSCHQACNDTGSLVCPQVCIINGCECPAGTVIDWERSECVRPNQCEACPIKGQVRMACASDPICHRACNRTGNLPCPLICIYDGCECPAGTVIDWSRNECVHPRQCEACPIEGQIRKECASPPSCHQTCNKTEPVACPRICIVDGCECPDGQVINEDGTKCVTPNECEVCPIKGQIKKECASYPSCHQTCNSTGLSVCPAVCIINGCECPDGQVIDEVKCQCVTPQECEACPIKGQIRKECASHPSCHRACNDTNPSVCPYVCINNGCECPTGTVIDWEKRECVRPNHCEVCPIKGQIRMECASPPSCHQTCNSTEPVACPAICIVNGCQCPPGTVIDWDKNECVLPGQCEACPIEGQIRKECASHPSCHRTCNTTRPMACPRICFVNGCECPAGQVIDVDRNRCVTPNECEACPVEGQIRRICASHPSCHQTCNNIGPIACPRICIVNGCECPLGTVIDETTNECVHPRECQVCPIKGQVRRECASHPSCHQTCNSTGSTICPAICIINGCECPEGTVIDEDKQECVPRSECEACPIKGQIRLECASDPSCHLACNSTGPVPCPRICVVNGCQCPAGTVIDWEKNECVHPRQCQACPIRGQIRKECAKHPSCHLACNSTGVVACPRICIVDGCECPDGTVIDWDTNECVAPSNCTACPVKGQIRRGCASPPRCHPTCKRTPTICPRICIIDGCECPPGTVIDEAINECVTPGECEVCPIKGQIRKECASDPSCQQACNSTGPTFCPYICIINGCECPTGTVIDWEKQECVPPNRCEACPIKGQIRMECASLPSCHLACNSTGPVPCPRICAVNGCECPTGSVIDWNKNECVLQRECEACHIEGQIRKECASPPSCHQTCNSTGPIACPSICIVDGCECPDGQVINENETKCVTPNECEDCPVQGQIRRECTSHPSCHQTCNSTGPVACPRICIANGCECPNGTIIDEATNECVAPIDCEACPIKGQIRKECASHPSCHRACNSTDPSVCPQICIINGCECPAGTVIDWEKRECVRPNQCEACPIKGQIRLECASPPSCHPACNSTGPVPCPLICVVNGCQCPTGTVIDWSKNECVLPRECEACPIEGQIRKLCASHPNCHRTCNSTGPVICPRICVVNGCECPDGQVIDVDRNRCVTPNECEDCLVEGQIRRPCASHPSCHQTCNDIGPGICPLSCIINGCECPNGTIIDEAKNECVAPNECEACPIKGQIRRECASPPSCHIACNSTGPVFCPRICITNGCECPFGMIIDWTKNECVTPIQCRVCPVQGQVRKVCATDPSCHRTCTSGFLPCPLICIIGGCECPMGTVISEDLNMCVPLEECNGIPMNESSCPIKGQIFTSDCFGTNATCYNPNPPIPEVCDSPKCVCPQGQVIDVEAKACIDGPECRGGCNITTIVAIVQYNNNRRRLNLTFLPNLRGQNAHFECRIDNQSFRSCTSPQVFRNLNLNPGQHTVTVRGSCMFNGIVTSTSTNTFTFEVRSS